jgi:hypothetical protein
VEIVSVVNDVIGSGVYLICCRGRAASRRASVGVLRWFAVLLVLCFAEAGSCLISRAGDRLPRARGVGEFIGFEVDG